MDSRLIAGAYSQHFRALEQDERERSDSIARAKKLSQETNKRRKVQAHKRKLEAKREERRRQEILTKRREEQKNATEKYQRSHVSPGSRQNSGRLSPQRYAAPCLDDALQLIRRSPRRERPSSGREGVLSPKSMNEDPLKRSYFNKPRHHSARPSSGRSTHHLNNEARAELMDYSLKNLTSSKSLFEQQLEQQQNLLLQKQQQSLREFSHAIQRELETGNEKENHGLEDEAENGEMGLSDSCSSVDSLERSEKEEEKILQDDGNNETNDFGMEKSNVSHEPSSQEQGFYLNPYLAETQNGNDLPSQILKPLNQDMTPSAIFQKESIANSDQKLRTDVRDEWKEKIPRAAYPNEVTKMELLDQQNSNNYPNFKTPMKQSSGDSLEELESSSSSISLIKVPECNDHSVRSVDSRAVNNGLRNTKSNYLSQVDERKQQGNSLMNNQVGFQKAPNEMCDNGENAFRNQNIQTFGTPTNQTGWELPSSRQGANVAGVRNEPVIESYNPRYASAIGLSIWPGHNQAGTTGPASTGTSVSNTHSNISSPYGKRTSSMSLMPSSTNSAPQNTSVKNPIPQHTQGNNYNKTENEYAQSGANITSAMTVTPVVTSTKPFISEMNNSNTLTAFKKQDLVYPLPQTYSQNNIPQNHTLLPTHTSTYDTLQQEIKQLSDQILENNMAGGASPSQATGTNSNTTASSSSLANQAERVQVIHHIPHANDFASGPVPVPSVRTVFPMSKPPVPNTYTAQHGQSNNKQDGLKPANLDSKGNDSSKHLTSTNDSTHSENGNHDHAMEEEAEGTKTLKGILKHLPPKVPSPGQQKGAVQARDSLELAKMQNEKKVKKKSVRFAAFVEESEEDYTSEDATSSYMLGPSNYKQGLNRPSSAKVVSQSSKFVVTSRPLRAASAGTVRHPVSVNHPQNDTSTKDENVSKAGQTHSNLPPQFSQPLNTAAPINRPKAAAHIIMSSESHYTSQKNESGSANTMASSLHKSQLEMKVKTVNNNFMSKVPVKVNANSNGLVYQVANPSMVSIVPSEHTPQTQQNTERSRIRDNSSSKRVPLSNSTVTRTSIVPASTKINYPVSNGVAPSYSTNNNNSNTQSSPVSTLDESKIRVDKTPTDEEINWVWDKVRNCLGKEGDKGETKQTPPSGNEQVARQPPVLSTKIIDGNSLGFNTNGAQTLRPGSGYFYTRNGGGAASGGPNKIKPAVQQQGSYLRRYGLLQQRRVNSATGTPSSAVAVQARAGSAGLMRFTSQGGQPMEGPKSIAFSYKPQENVSESTAAFIMAERLAKQSLTDSHIAVAMDDAQSKQETYNNRARLAPTAAGPSALSLEEQRLMESLDKLNERLNVPDQKSYSGTIHYHQPYQAHLPGFRGHQGLGNTRHQLSPRGHQRSQSARIRQQIRQYR